MTLAASCGKLKAHLEKKSSACFTLIQKQPFYNTNYWKCPNAIPAYQCAGQSPLQELPFALVQLATAHLHLKSRWSMDSYAVEPHLEADDLAVSPKATPQSKRSTQTKSRPKVWTQWPVLCRGSLQWFLGTLTSNVLLTVACFSSKKNLRDATNDVRLQMSASKSNAFSSAFMLHRFAWSARWRLTFSAARHGKLLVTVCSTTRLLEEGVLFLGTVLKAFTISRTNTIKNTLKWTTWTWAQKHYVKSTLFWINLKNSSAASVWWYWLFHQQDGTTVVLKVRYHSWAATEAGNTLCKYMTMPSTHAVVVLVLHNTSTTKKNRKTCKWGLDPRKKTEKARAGAYGVTASVILLSKSRTGNCRSSFMYSSVPALQTLRHTSLQPPHFSMNLHLEVSF